MDYCDAGVPVEDVWLFLFSIAQFFFLRGKIYLQTKSSLR